MRALKLWCLLVLVLSVGVALLSECRAYDRDAYARFTDGGGLSDATSDVRDSSMDVVIDVSTCPTGLSPCNGMCIDLTTSPQNCGMCGRACPGTTCSGSQCTNDCVFARLNCDGNTVNGCETAAATDQQHCGSCTNACSDTQMCQGGTCHTTVPPGGGCSASADCGAGGLCLTDAMGYPGGYCSGACSACPTGTVCSPDYPYCLARCTGPTDCRSGYLCANTAQGSLCVPDCTQDVSRTAAVCGAGRCDGVSHVCRGTCSIPTDCATGSTCDATMRCACSAVTTCGNNHACVGGNCGCTNDNACPQGQHCATDTGACS